MGTVGFPGMSFTKEQAQDAYNRLIKEREMSEPFEEQATEAVKKSLSYHKPGDEGMAAIAKIRGQSTEFGKMIIALCPAGRERSVAITKLEETAMWAIKSIAMKGEPV